MKISLHPGAERDVAEFKRVSQLLLENPGFGSERAGGRRTFPAKGFPYSIIYRPMPDGIRILGVKHDKPKPDFGIARK